MKTPISNSAALVVSLISLVVSILTYEHSTHKPELEVNGSAERVPAKETKSGVAGNLIEISIKNTGKAAAKNVRLTLWNLYDKTPRIFMGPEKDYQSSVNQGILKISIPVIGKGNEQHVFVTDRVKSGAILSPGYDNTYFLNIDSEEGIDKSTIFRVKGSDVVYGCLDCHWQ